MGAINLALADILTAELTATLKLEAYYMYYVGGIAFILWVLWAHTHTVPTPPSLHSALQCH